MYRNILGACVSPLLCPEGNLSNGIFPLTISQTAGGKWSIGTDNHLRISPMEELRLLDYGQRLRSHQRNSYFDQDQADSGTYGIEMALQTERKATNHHSSDFFKAGEALNVCVFCATPLLTQRLLQK